MANTAPSSQNLREIKTGQTAAVKILGEATLYAAAFLFALLFFVALKPYYEYEGVPRGAVSQSVTALLVVACAALGAYFKLSGKLTAKRLIFLMLAAGLALRLNTMLCTPAGWYTPTQMLQMDTYTPRGDGHEGYAWTIFSTGKLPATNDYQFYHPPLNALLQAGFMRFMSGLSSALGIAPDAFLAGKPAYIEAERYFLYSSCQILSLLYSFAVCVVSLKILKLFRLQGKPLVLAAAFMIFYPRGIQFSGALNNDGIAYLLSILALFFVLKWWKKGKKWQELLLCGASTGLGMMAKLSAATICLPIAGVFVYEFIRTVGKKEGALPLPELLGQYAAFLAVCAPVGLWFQVYAYVRFDQPFGYVFSNLNGALSTRRRSWWERFSPVVFDKHEYFDSLWCHTFGWNYNLLHFSLRSSIFGEFNQYSRGENFAFVAVVTAYLSLILLLAALVRAGYLFFKHDLKKKDARAEERKRNVLFVFLLVSSQVLSEIFFYVRMPYSCTMDFRYVMPLILGMALTLWLALGRLKEEGGKFSTALCRAVKACVGVFLLSSALFYMVFV